MISPLLFILFLAASQEQVPFKPASDIEVIVDFTFMERPAIDRTKVEYDVATDEKNRKAISGPLPYLKMDIKIVRLNNEETRLRMINSQGHLMYNRKATVGTVLKLNLGFTDDIKDRIMPHAFDIFFLTDQKKKVSRIHLIILEDGTFLVNDEVRGKF
jgi:hypothetical protein